MHRTAAPGVRPILAALLVALAALVVALLTHAHAAAAPTATPEPPEPPVTANEFFPEERNVTDCIGVLERPGCGSESRGGWRQTLVFGLVAAGLVVVFTKITIGVRRGRAGEPGDRSAS